VYVNVARVVIRLHEAAYPDGPADEIVSFRAYPDEGDFDASGVTEDTRRWLLAGRHDRFTFEERRSYTDAGAAGAGVTYIVDLLAASITGVAVHEIVDFIKRRIGAPSGGDWQRDRFRQESTERLRDEALSSAERVLDFGRGALVVSDFERGEFEITVRAELPNGHRFRITLNADETLRVRRLPNKVHREDPKD
jgi:hypothetical protein